MVITTTTLNLGGKKYIFAPVENGDEFPRLVILDSVIEVSSITLLCGTKLTKQTIFQIIADKIQRN
jgi:hypothetical protein